MSDYEAQEGTNITTVTFTYSSSNVISQNDIYFDSQEPWRVDRSLTKYSTNKDFHSTARHELGHWFSLGHVSDETHAMNTYYTPHHDAEGADLIYTTY